MLYIVFEYVFYLILVLVMGLTVFVLTALYLLTREGLSLAASTFRNLLHGLTQRLAPYLDTVGTFAILRPHVVKVGGSLEDRRSTTQNAA